MISDDFEDDDDDESEQPATTIIVSTTTTAPTTTNAQETDTDNLRTFIFNSLRKGGAVFQRFFLSSSMAPLISKCLSEQDLQHINNLSTSGISTKTQIDTSLQIQQQQKRELAKDYNQYLTNEFEENQCICRGYLNDRRYPSTWVKCSGCNSWSQQDVQVLLVKFICITIY
eukprot:UN00959